MLDRVDDVAEPVDRGNDVVDDDVLNTTLPGWPIPELTGCVDVVWVDGIAACTDSF